MFLSCSLRCFLSCTANGLAPRTLPRSIGSLNVFTNVAWLPRRPGWAKSMRDHKSWSAFCTGVPVSRIRQEDSSWRRLLPKRVEMFFILCASSQMTMSQGRTDPLLGSSPPSGSSGSRGSSSPLASSSPSSSSIFRRLLGLGPPLPWPLPPLLWTGDGASSTITRKRSSTFPISAYEVRSRPPCGLLTRRSACARCAADP
mmetsp:Transcript_103800/g.274454  ORF Transcript_103800/g.274454 Transcript_103800/m.274454 type:complete len:200 (+) Transcript_103800:3109-3708(+)